MVLTPRSGAPSRPEKDGAELCRAAGARASILLPAGYPSCLVRCQWLQEVQCVGRQVLADEWAGGVLITWSLSSSLLSARTL